MDSSLASDPVLLSRSIFDWLRLQVFFSPASAPAPIKRRLSTIKIFVKHHYFFLTRKMPFISIRFLNNLLSMWKLTKRISLRTSSVLCKVEPEPVLYTGSGQKVPAPNGSGSATLSSGRKEKAVVLNSALSLCYAPVGMVCAKIYKGFFF